MTTTPPVGVVFADDGASGLKAVQRVRMRRSERAAWLNDTEEDIPCIHENLH